MPPPPGKDKRNIPATSGITVALRQDCRHNAGIMSAARILVVEDDQAIADVLLFVLEQRGYAVEHAADGKAGLECFQRGKPDLVVLDLNLPRLSGHGLFREMRNLDPAIPVIMVSCLSSDIDRVAGLQMGADDYVSKPFNNDELVARVGNLLRRCGHGATAIRTLSHGPFAMDPSARVFRYFGSPVELTRPEFDLMTALVEHPLRTFSRNALIGHIYNDSHPVTDRSVDSCVKRIRQKLQAVHPDIDPIRTVYGMGYQLGIARGTRS